MVIQNWVDVVAVSLQDLWSRFVGLLPRLLGALATLIIGLIVAAVLERIVERVLFYLKLDNLLKNLGVDAYLHRANITLNFGHFVGRIVYWFVVLVFLLAASDILNFSALSLFIQDVLNYIPNVFVAILIMLVTLIVAKFLKGLTTASVLSARLHAAKALGALTWWSVFVFGLLTALLQLGIAVSVINTLITGLIAMLAIAGGLAFGLGGKEYASYLVNRLREETGHQG